MAHEVYIPGKPITGKQECHLHPHILPLFANAAAAASMSPLY